MTSMISFITHGRLAWGIHGIPNVSLGPTMPYPSTPSYGRIKGGRPAAVLLPLWIPHAIRLCLLLTLSILALEKS
jgi:hypothetical protein